MITADKSSAPPGKGRGILVDLSEGITVALSVCAALVEFPIFAVKDRTWAQTVDALGDGRMADSRFTTVAERSQLVPSCYPCSRS